MNPHDVEILAKTLIHEFAPAGYTFRWNNLKRVNGRCVYADKAIELSRHLTPLRTPQAIQQTIMHEIAHALTKGNGHGSLWKAQMRRFGLPDHRCSQDRPDLTAIANWRAVCWNCGKKSFMMRKPRVTKACGVCCKGKYNSKYDLTFLPI